MGECCAGRAADAAGSRRRCGRGEPSPCADLRALSFDDSARLQCTRTQQKQNEQTNKQREQTNKQRGRILGEGRRKGRGREGRGRRERRDRAERGDRRTLPPTVTVTSSATGPKPLPVTVSKLPPVTRGVSTCPRSLGAVRTLSMAPPLEATPYGTHRSLSQAPTVARSRENGLARESDGGWKGGHSLLVGRG